MREFSHSIATDRYLYAALILLDTPGWVGYSMHITLPPSVESDPLYIGVGIIIIALNALLFLAMFSDGVMTLVEFLKER
jgi:hypothetical protein